MIKCIIKFFKRIYDLGEKGTLWIGNQFMNTDFLNNHLISLFSLCILYFGKDLFYKTYLDQGTFNLSSVNFIYYSLYYFVIFMVFFSVYLIYYVYYIKDKENKLKKDGYIKFLEDEYKTTYENFSKGLGFFITLLISGIAIYMTIISMQTSLDVANGTLSGKIDLNNTFIMFKQLGMGIAILIFIFIICFFYYRFNIISKNNYVKEKYYSVFKKSNKK